MQSLCAGQKTRARKQPERLLQDTQNEGRGWLTPEWQRFFFLVSLSFFELQVTGEPLEPLRASVIFCSNLGRLDTHVPGMQWTLCLQLQSQCALCLHAPRLFGLIVNFFMYTIIAFRPVLHCR